MCNITKDNSFISLNSVIAQGESEKKKVIYRIKRRDQRPLLEQESHSTFKQEMTEYVSVKVKRQTYNGKMSAAIYIRDQTRKIKEHVRKRIEREKKQQA